MYQELYKTIFSPQKKNESKNKKNESKSSVKLKQIRQKQLPKQIGTTSLYVPNAASFHPYWCMNFIIFMMQKFRK